jgi:hypothetical protein
MKPSTWAGVLLAGCLSLAAVVVFAADTATAIKADTIKAEPFRDARTVGNLAAGDRLEILKKEGGWLRVKSAKGTGWVRMLSVRRGDAARRGSDVSGLLGMASGRAGTGHVVATTGVRGLNEEELKSAKFSASELRIADGYMVSAKEARSFAAKGKLTARKLDYLPDPAGKGDSQ